MLGRRRCGRHGQEGTPVVARWRGAKRPDLVFQGCRRCGSGVP
ncbi:hypothetical protein T261_06633 [Streptomyces lydicus]|nr:hypothetical protein T261_06633 [Streptomyces lydicus]